jgi:hypothetical protein
MTKAFHIGDVLSITTGKLVAKQGISGVYDILDFMTGESLMTHQLPRAADHAKVYLWRQFPQLIEVTAPAKFEDEEHVWSWLAHQEELFGSTFEVAPLPEDVYDVQDPIAELIEMRGSADGVTVMVLD